MRFCVIGGANADIVATTFLGFVPKDSNPGTIRLTPGGVARNIAHNLALLGDEVIFLTLFGEDAFGKFTAQSCRKAGIDISLCDAAPIGTRSCFLCINDRDGEMVGGVADMTAVDSITPDWIAKKMESLGSIDAFVADANLSVEALVFLIDHVNAPLYIDAVSGAKAPRIKEALERSERKCIHTLKCNRMEEILLSRTKGITRRYISLGAEGVDIIEDNNVTHHYSLPCHVVNTTGAGDALMAGIVHAGPQATADEAVSIGLRCAKITVECADTVNPQLKQKYEELS